MIWTGVLHRDEQNPSLLPPSIMTQNALEYLLKAQTEAGGWGYSPSSKGNLEATAIVLFALRGNLQASKAVRKGIEWILSFQNPDGGWGICPGDEESGWQTAWGIFILSTLQPGSQASLRGAQWLLDVDVMQYTDSELLSAGKEVAQIDFSIRGWPWLPGESSWVEPTALAMRALRDYLSLAGAEARIQEAVLYLKDRRCMGGGWNVGNPVMFAAGLPARVVPTSLAILALGETAPGEIQPEDLQSLHQEMHQDRGTLALAWGLIALHELGEEDAEARSALIASQDADGSWNGSPYITAVSYLALEDGE